MWEKNINKHEEEETHCCYFFFHIVFNKLLYSLKKCNFFKRIFVLLHVMFFYNKVPCFPTLHYSTNY